MKLQNDNCENYQKLFTLIMPVVMNKLKTEYNIYPGIKYTTI
jgi:hypothetical protein